jgi:predicted patatin/cPLA2 family phospholipase
MKGKYNCGLVLEGGGSRAIYTSGVLDAFLEEGLEFPYVIGVSAGACNGASFLGKALHRQHEIMMDYIKDSRYMSFESMFKNGEYLNSEWIFNELSYDLCPLDHDQFENSDATFCTVVTNALTGKAEYLYPDSLRQRGCPEIRASCSLPLATKGTEIGGELYYDGGLADSIPLQRALEDGCQKCVVILTQHKGYVKKPMPGDAHKVFKQYPLLADVINERHEMYNQQLIEVEAAEEAGRAFVIRPARDLECSAIEKNTVKLERIYQLGYQQAKHRMPRIREFINQ